jgi:hypothetical protein
MAEFRKLRLGIERLARRTASRKDVLFRGGGGYLNVQAQRSQKSVQDSSAAGGWHCILLLLSLVGRG